MRPTPRTVPWPSSSISKTSALANSVPTSSAVQAASASPSSRCQIRRQKAIRPPRPSPCAHGRRDGGQRVGEALAAGPLPWAISGRPPPLPSIAGTAAPDEVAGGDAARDEVVADGHEELRLVGVETERDDAGLEAPRTSFAAAFSASIDSYGAGERHEPDAGRDLLGAARPARRASAGLLAATRPEAPLRLAQLVLEGAGSVPRARPRTGRRRHPSRARASRSAPSTQRVGAGAGDRLDAPHPRADDALAGDDEPADLAGRPAVGAAAQLVAVVLDPDGPDRLAVLLVEERVGAGVDRLRHRHVRGGDRPVVADDRAGPRPRSRAARRRSGARSNGKSKRR